MFSCKVFHLFEISQLNFSSFLFSRILFHLEMSAFVYLLGLMKKKKWKKNHTYWHTVKTREVAAAAVWRAAAHYHGTWGWEYNEGFPCERARAS